ncbi:MAG: formate/nitrite transporter family protein [Dermabacter sp.]|nr:formate/nitrite transporter family protein [Dermabacter sp.]
MNDLSSKITIPTPPVMAKAMEDGMLAKAMNPAWKVFLLGLTGGAYIAFGFIMFVTTQQGAPGEFPLGVTRLIGGMAFATGLIMVINSGSDLFTGTTMTVMPLLSKRLAPGRFATHWLISYTANFIGSVFVAVLIFLAGTHASNKSAWGLVVLNTTQAKVNLDWGHAFFLGILANTLVCMAVWMTFAGRSFFDKALAIVVPLMIFVGTGFEHSVANMFMLPMGWLIKTFGNDAFWAGEAIQNAGVSASDFDSISWTSIWVNNLIPVTLGNIIGGALFVGTYFWLAYRKDAVKKEQAELASEAAQK